ncbi:PAAR motif protein [Acinetobacter stercoris]|uniref:PAAR motif protein n=1 Tax=Acinetobacter stercoris TaxID=2126983 RepID=A0A2U3MUP9_9GAMM|nr:PAAR motif protein [Acinetobacter stercoris]
MVEGIPIACVGHKASCPLHKTVSTIVSGDQYFQVSGRPTARAGDSLSCGCKLLPKQSLVVGDNGGGMSRGSAGMSAAAQQQSLSKSDLTNNLREKEKHEIYYIERNKTDHVSFKTFLPPYDEDRKSLLGVATQVLSGACTFFVTYIVKDLELFITVSYIPPVLKNDAKIIPTGTVNISREKSLLTSKNLELKEGYWDTTKGKEPVGSCKIQLPEPNLQIVTVSIVLGYIAKFDGGSLIPTPPSTKYTFTLSSASRPIS